MAAGHDEAFIRPRGRVLIGAVPSANARWRERLERNVTTIARGFEFDLRSVAVRAASRGWPVIDGLVSDRPFPIGCFDGLRVSWLAWFERGLEVHAPDWSLRADGRLVAADARMIATEEVVANLARLHVCDDLGTVDDRRRAYDAELALARVNAGNALADLGRQLGAGPRARSAASAASPGV